jgi:proline iminopeptidase
MGGLATVRLRDGSELWTAVAGTGPPVVCLHGGPGLWDYLAPLAALIDNTFTVVRFDQRGCGRSTGGGPFTITQAVDDLEQVRAALGFGQWAIAGHSWGAELALRYTARHQARTTAVAYISGVGAGNGYKDAHVAELDRRLGPDRERWVALSAIPAGDRTQAEEIERCLLQWRTDFSPGPDAATRALALWKTRPPGAVINAAANRELWQDRAAEGLVLVTTGSTARTGLVGFAEMAPYVTAAADRPSWSTRSRSPPPRSSSPRRYRRRPPGNPRPGALTRMPTRTGGSPCAGTCPAWATAGGSSGPTG